MNIKQTISGFLEKESSPPIMMLVFGLLSFIIMNSTFSDDLQLIINHPILAHFSVKFFVQDILMVFFFLVVGMQIKYEICEGLLSDKGDVILPLIVAIGGSIAPAIIFILINLETPQFWHGWAISSPTDIAFALAILMAAGNRIPHSLKIFLLAIAIFDDLVAVIIIALFYGQKISLIPLLMVIGGIAILALLNRLRVMAFSPYFIAGTLLWWFLYHSGIHTTICGVVVGMTIPMRDPNNKAYSPLNDCLKFFLPIVNFIILPIFAFTSCAITLKGMDINLLLDPLVIGIALGLFIGKQIGIFGTTWLMVKVGISQLPKDGNWQHIYVVSIIAGIGFTMSLFIGELAFSDQIIQRYIKLGIICGSTISAIVGLLAARFIR